MNMECTLSFSWQGQSLCDVQLWAVSFEKGSFGLFKWEQGWARTHDLGRKRLLHPLQISKDLAANTWKVSIKEIMELLRLEKPSKGIKSNC